MCFWPRTSKAREPRHSLDSVAGEKTVMTIKKACQSEKYQKLSTTPQEIRLVTIEPPSLDSAMRVTLRTVPHAEMKGRYFCLSYAWGSSKDRMPILVNGRKHRVTCNLYSLLRRLQLLPQSKDIWIDALCINQDDLVEKASQVSVMYSLSMSLHDQI